MASGPADDRLLVDINITPFVDILLVILVLFLVVATIAEERTIGVELPAASQTDAAPPTSVGLTVTAGGVVLVDGEAMTRARLREVLRQRRANEPNIDALIAADAATSWQELVGLVDLLRAEGYTSYHFGVDEDLVRASALADGEARP